MDKAHAANIGIIMLRLAWHEPGDFGDSSLNDPVVNIVDEGQPAENLVRYLARMPKDEAKSRADSIIDQGGLVVFG